MQKLLENYVKLIKNKHLSIISLDLLTTDVAPDLVMNYSILPHLPNFKTRWGIWERLFHWQFNIYHAYRVHLLVSSLIYQIVMKWFMKLYGSAPRKCWGFIFEFYYQFNGNPKGLRFNLICLNYVWLTNTISINWSNKRTLILEKIDFNCVNFFQFKHWIGIWLFFHWPQHLIKRTVTHFLVILRSLQG